MYPNTECVSDCYRPGDCDGSCTHPRPVAAPQQPALSDYERGRQAVLDAITYVGSDGGVYNSFREAVDLRRYL